MCSGVTRSAVLGRGRREQQVDAGVVLDERPGVRRSASIGGAVTTSTIDLAVDAEVEEDPVVAELEDAVDEGDLAVELAMERDRRVDRDRRRADAALGAVEREHLARAAAGRRAASSCGAKRASRLLHPGQQLGLVERLDQVVVGAGAQAADLLLDLLLGGQHDDRDVASPAFVGPDLRRRPA